MNSLKSFLIVFVIASAESGSPREPYLIYATEGIFATNFYENNLNLSSPQGILTVWNLRERLSNFFFSQHENYRVLYYSFKNSTIIGRYEFSSGITLEKKLDEDSNRTFVGLGNNEKIYLYFPHKKTLRVYDFQSELKLEEFDELKNVSTDLHCVDVDPRDKDRLYFVECSGKQYKGSVFDIYKKRILSAYNQPLPKCFDTWRITPNGKQTYAVEGAHIYVSQNEGDPFTKYLTADARISGFAVGNNELFYSTTVGQSSILFKVTPSKDKKGFQKSQIDVWEGTVTKMALYQYWQPNHYLIYATEGPGKSLSVYKTDFTLQKREKLLITCAVRKPVVNWYINHCENGHVLYWSYEGSDFTARLNISDRSFSLAKIPGVSKGVFLGPSDVGNLYFYFSKDRKIGVYNFMTRSFEKDLDGLATSKVKKNLFTRDPRHNEQIFFAECSRTSQSGKVFDLKNNKILQTYDLRLPKCFDKWAFTPNAKQAHAVKGIDVYMSSREGAPFVKYYNLEDKVDSFAVGNNDIFFTTDEYGKIFRLTRGRRGLLYEYEYDVGEKVAALVLYEQTEFKVPC